jgi:hypothetical protein
MGAQDYTGGRGGRFRRIRERHDGRIRGNPMLRFLWWTGGVHVPTIENRRCTTDRFRMALPGAFILFVSLWASATAFNLIRYVTDDPRVQALTACGWGLFVLLMDVSIVASVRKRARKTGSAGVGLTLFRVVAAVILSLAISESFKLWLFHPEIELELERERQAMMVEEERKLNARFIEIDMLEQQDSLLLAELQAEKKELK